MTNEITNETIKMLRDEAGSAGDTEQVAICTRALAGDDDAREECARVIEDAMAMVDYRAAYVGETVLTGPEHAHMSDADLVTEALAEARRAGLLGDEPHQITADDLEIGTWRVAR